MKILIVSDFNIAGQCTFLMRAINKYTHHEARCVIAYKDHFDYDKDILLQVDGQEGLEEATFLANEWADFYHFGSYIFNWPGVDFNELVNPWNCCIKYYGSYLRDNGARIRQFHAQTKLPAITGNDYTITKQLPESFYHLNSYFTAFGDMENPPLCNYAKKPFRICAGSAGNPLKGYDFFMETVKDLQDEGVDIEVDLISGVSNDECLKRKRECHATFGSLHGGWGISGVESFWLGHRVLTCLDPFVMSMFPDNPTVLVDRNNLRSALKEEAERVNGVQYGYDWSQVEHNAKQAQLFAYQNFSTKKILARYMYIFDLIRHSEDYLRGGNLPEDIWKVD